MTLNFVMKDNNSPIKFLLSDNNNYSRLHSSNEVKHFYVHFIECTLFWCYLWLSLSLISQRCSAAVISANHYLVRLHRQALPYVTEVVQALNLASSVSDGVGLSYTFYRTVDAEIMDSPVWALTTSEPVNLD